MIGSPLSPSPPRHRRRPCHRSDSRRARRVPAGRGAATAPRGDDCAAWVRCQGVSRIRVWSNARKSPPGGAVAPTPTLQPPGPSPAAQRRGRESGVCPADVRADAHPPGGPPRPCAGSLRASASYSHCGSPRAVTGREVKAWSQRPLWVRVPAGLSSEYCFTLRLIRDTGMRLVSVNKWPLL